MSRIVVEIAGGVGAVYLNRPEKKNALDREMAEELNTAMEQLGGDKAVRAITLAGRGDDFCAGADLQSLEQMISEGEKAHLQDAQALGRVFITMRTIQKPIVAIVRGRALAGGAGLATACDMILAHEAATFGYPEVRVGFVPAMVMTMLRRSVGEKRAFDLVATGRPLTAREALDMGLVSRVIAAEVFDFETGGIVAQLAEAPISAMMITKRLFYALDDLDFRQGIAAGVKANIEARLTDDFREGVRRFLNRDRAKP